VAVILGSVVQVTEWAEFRTIDPVWATRLKPVQITIINGRNTFNAAARRAVTWTFLGLGRQ